MMALVGPGYRGRWALVVVAALAASGLEVLGALVVVGLLARITTEASGFELPLIGDVRDLLPTMSETALLLVIGAAVAVFFVVRGMVIVVQAYLQHRVAENAGARLAARLLEGYLAMPYTFHLQRNSAELVRNSYDNVQHFVREALVPAVKLASHTLMILGLLAVLVVTAPVATAIAVFTLGPFTWLLLRIVHPKVKQLGKESQEMSRTSLQTLHESLAGWRDITVLGRHAAFVDRFRDDRRRLARARYLRNAARELPRVALETGLVLFILAFLGVSVLAGGGALDALPVLGLFGYVAVRLQPSLNDVLHALNALKFAGPGIDAIHADLQLFRERDAISAGPASPRPLLRELRFDHVGARYPDATTDAVREIDLTIHAGEFIGIVGPTGGGKSTLVDLALGLLEPSTGRVLLDGRDLREDLPGWHASLGVVHQTVFLVDDTVRRNIAMGVPDDEIDEARVIEALEQAQLRSFVAELPGGLGAVIGEDGVRVSGGQRQRLAIARALYRRPSVLVFDEGTSSLDSHTEFQLMEAVEELRGERTIIAVAHRLSTVRSCDRVLLVDRGRLVDAAPFDVLAARHSTLLRANA